MDRVVNSHLAERAELEAVLSSEIFMRAPNVAQMLAYICKQRFAGEEDQLKEYSIAVEALRRPPDFNQKQDSIVRVEAHRLRKRLQLYYATEGTGHSLRIEVPPGSYVPLFVPQESAPPVALDLAPDPSDSQDALEETGGVRPEQRESVPSSQLASVTIARPIDSSARRNPPYGWIAALLAGAILVPTYFFAVKGSKRISADTAPAVVIATPPHAAIEGQAVRILAGSSVGRYLDPLGNEWGGDRFYTGGRAASSPHRRIQFTNDSFFFDNRREGNFTYDIPLKPGVYELHLLFAETVYGENNFAGGGESSRISNVFVNGKNLLYGLDVVTEAGGGNIALVRTFKDITPDSAGILHLSFQTIKDSAFVNAIEIVPGIKGRMIPVRILARSGSQYDRAGNLWGPDQFVSGGQNVLRHDPIAGTSDPDLFNGERFGRITYSIPVATPGPYALTLLLSERYFGISAPGGGGAGSRLFDILCNGVALARRFDITKESGGSGRALKKTFHGLEPSAQGQLLISLVPVVNYASLNGLEVVDESR